MLRSILICDAKQVRYSKRDALIGAAIMIGASLALVIAGVAARRSGWQATGEILVGFSFPVSLMLSMPFWLMKGQPWKAQAAVVGGTLLALAAIAAFL